MIHLYPYTISKSSIEFQECCCTACVLSADTAPSHPRYPTLSYCIHTPPSTNVFANPDKQYARINPQIRQRFVFVSLLIERSILSMHIMVCTSDKKRRLPVSTALELFVLNDLNPVVVGIEHKSNILHASICQALLPVDTLVLESLASGIQIINGDTCTLAKSNCLKFLGLQICPNP